MLTEDDRNFVFVEAALKSSAPNSRVVDVIKIGPCGHLGLHQSPQAPEQVGDLFKK